MTVIKHRYNRLVRVKGKILLKLGKAAVILAYYFLILDNTCAELYEGSDHSTLYELLLLFTDEALYDKYVNLDKTIEQKYGDLLVCSSVSDVDDIIKLASLTIAGNEYDWETE